MEGNGRSAEITYKSPFISCLIFESNSKSRMKIINGTARNFFRIMDNKII